MAMNRPIYPGKTWAEFRGGRETVAMAPADAPVLSIVTRLSLLGYLLTLAITQTVYGGPFMTARWGMLGILAASSSADMILLSRHGHFRARAGHGLIMVIYLLLTFGTVVYAENWMFSGMRWASHAAMLVILMILLPQLITFRQIRQLLPVLKYTMAILVIASWIPSASSRDNAGLYQGVMGNANTMGHISFITAFLFLQSYITEKLPRRRGLSGVICLIAIISVWKTGARSSMIALIVGALMLCYYYRRSMRGVVLATILTASLVMVSFPKVPQQIFKFAQKTDRYLEKKGAMQSRIPVWTAAYAGFKQRPLLGWGFGADNKISKEWKMKFTSIGTVDRDPVNDFLFMMEGGGIVGLGSYMLLIIVVLRQRPGKRQISKLQNFSHDSSPDPAMPLHHAHAGLFILSVCLLVLNQFDNSALSAGNLISVTLWLGAGCASTLRNEIGNR